MSDAADEPVRLLCERCTGTYLVKFRDEEHWQRVRIVQCPACLHMNSMPEVTLAQQKLNQPDSSPPIPLEYLTANFYPRVPVTELVHNLKTVELRGPVMAFVENITRLQSTLIFPVHVAAYSRLFEQKKAIAVAEIKVSETDPNYKEAIDDRTIDLCTKWISETDDDQKGAFIARNGVGAFVRLSSAPIRAASEAILISQITGTWTAFETLAQDLWITALNAHPRKLAGLRGKRWDDEDHESNSAAVSSDDPELSGSQSADEYCEESKRWVRLSDIERERFDIQKRMGTVLAEKFDFSVLEEIREAYWQAFKNRRGEIRNAVQNQSLDALSAVRNVVVHNSGKVDAAFLLRIKRLPKDDFAYLHATPKGSYLPITGTFIERLVRGAIEVGMDLIKAVDTWLVLPVSESMQ